MNPVYALQRINPWWQTGVVDHSLLHKRKRSEFSDIIKSLDEKGITLLSGPSEAGKTTLLYQTVHHLLTLGISPKRVLMFSGDEMTIFGEHRSIGSLLEFYTTDLLHENLFALKSPVFVLIDDIQYIDDWQIYVVNYMQKADNLKFVIAQPPVPSTVAEEELPEGSFVKIPVMPLTQSQYAEFYGVYKPMDIDLIRFKSLLPGVPLFENPAEYCSELESNIFPLGDYKPYKIKIMDDYLLGGGFLRSFSSDEAKWSKELMAILDRAVYRDIAAPCCIKAPHKLKRLMYLIASSGSKEQSFGSLGRSLYLDTSTIIAYISALCTGGLAGVAENYSAVAGSSEGRVIRKNKRLYILDTGIRNALLRSTGVTAEYGVLVTSACIYMAREYASKTGGNVYFWKDGSRQADIVISNDDMLLPICVSYSGDTAERSVKGMRVFMRANRCKTALVITRDTLKREGGIIFIPYWMI